MLPARILIVDDEEGVRAALARTLEYQGYAVHLAAAGPEALHLCQEEHPDLVLLDVKMPRMDGLEVLEQLQERDPDATVVMISGHGTVETAVAALKLGAYDFLEKPLDEERVLLTVRNALGARQLQEENRLWRQDEERRYRIVGEHRALKEVLATAATVAPSTARVLIRGENGTGKELVARYIHRMSKRAAGPFVEVNCAAIPPELVESELFGHEKGAFTGAHALRHGKFEQAHGGTLFLDEVGDMSLAAQAKVLRVLQEGRIQRVGGSRDIPVDVRVIAATNKEIESEIARGTFREDLLYRLNVVTISLPPLGERRSDIPLLVAHFLEAFGRENGTRPKAIAPEALRLLEETPWPGSVRELRNAVERLAILSPGERIEAADVRRLVGRLAEGRRAWPEEFRTFKEFREEAERRFLEEKLRENGWNVSETARRLEMQRSNLYKKLERYGLSREGGGGTASRGSGPAADGS